LVQEAIEDPATSWVGQVIDSRYRVLEAVGRGATGVVYKVEHTRMGKIAALKILHQDLVVDREHLERFHREAEAISKLDHPNIVQIFDFGLTGDMAYLVMEFLKGEDLRHILERDQLLGFPRSAAILVQICSALAEAHEIGIIHRDLKPENIRVGRTREGVDFVKVLDFGLAKMVGDDPSPNATGQGKLLGTPYYMAPEQIRGEVLDRRCDIYALGAIAYRMVTGLQAFGSSTPIAVLTRHLTEDLVAPSIANPKAQISPAIDALIIKAMAKDRDQRYQTAHEMREAIYHTGETEIGVSGVSRHSLPPFLLTDELRRASDSGQSSPSRSGDAGGPPAELGLAITAPLTWDPEKVPAPGKPAADTGSLEPLEIERQIRRNTALKVFSLLLLIGGAGATFYWFVMREPASPFLSLAEQEPNNKPAQALRLRPNARILGKIGQRLSPTESDRDWYKLEIQGSGRFLIRASVSAIPNIDLVLAIYDDAGKHPLVSANEARKGGGEVITNWPIVAGSYYLLVREQWIDGIAPTENVTDSYRLEVGWAPFSQGQELEPNDTSESANPIALGRVVHGYLSRRDDRDVYRFETGPGLLNAALAGPKDVNTVLLVTVGSKKPLRIDRRGAGEGEQLERLALEVKTSVSLEVRRSSRQANQPTDVSVGRDEPYSLRVWQEEKSR
jgi:serine/threonine-protein kinase